MTRVLTIAILSCIVMSSLSAQDIIIQKSGDEMEAKVLEIGLDVVKYKRYDNPEGPTYTLSKGDIFMIKYENGSKDMFSDEASTKKAKASVDRRKMPYEKDSSLDQYLVENKDDEYVVKDYQFDVQRVVDAQKVYYYGVDFSSVLLVNSLKYGQEEELNKYFLAWFAFFEKELPSQKYIIKWLQKDELVECQKTMHDYIEEIDREWIAYDMDEGLSIEQVQNITRANLDIIEESEGVGFYLLPDAFDKENELVYVYVNFFDLASGNLLWSTKISSPTGGNGMTAYWGHGVRRSLKLYIDFVYAKTVKKYK